MRIIKILSSGHSGSTVLGAVLGNLPQTIRVGEFTNFYKVVAGTLETCSCGQLPEACGFWKQVLARFDIFLLAHQLTLSDYEKIRVEVESNILKRKPKQEHWSLYVLMTKKLMRCIAEVSGKEVIVDSSKSPARAYALSQVFTGDMLILLLTRDATGVVNSYRRKRGAFPLVPFLFQQLKEHAKFVYVLLRSKSHSERIRYEDLFSQKKMNALLSNMKMDASLNISRPMQNQHVIAGNRFRFQPSFSLQRGESKKVRLPFWDRFLCWLLDIVRRLV